MFVTISNTPRDYAWGSTELISRYLNRTPTGGPEAELWLGAHPNNPSLVHSGLYAGLDLREAIDAEGGEPPSILLKVLAAAAPLSLQVHPTEAQASSGFEREESSGIARDAAGRNYRDRFAKPEILVAVTPFEALSGFRPQVQAEQVFDRLASLDARLSPVAMRVRAGDALEWLLSDSAEVASAVSAVAEQSEAMASDFPTEADTIARLSSAYPGDPGVLVALLLNRVSLKPGEAIFLPAGNLHAYLEGLGIELMGSSDNVLRGGLTAKHVDVPELLAVVDRSPLIEPRMKPVLLAGATAYQPDAPFELRRIEGLHRVDAGRGLLLTVVDAHIEVDGHAIDLAPAEAAWIDTARSYSIDSTEAWLALERG